MFDAIIRWSVRNKLAIGFLIALWIGGGLYALQQLPIDAVPDITNNQVQVITTAPRLAAQEVEQYLTYPLETQLNTLPQLVELRSISRQGLSVITLVFDESVDPWLARQWVSERLAEVRNQIPAELGNPQLAPPTTGLGEIYQYTLEVDSAWRSRYSLTELRTLQEWVVKRQLLGTPGVAEVSSLGGFTRQYEVALDPDRLRAYGLGFGDIIRTLETNNENTGAAYLERGPEGHFIRGLGLLRTPDEIEGLVVALRGGQPLTLGQVGQVVEGGALRLGALSQNGRGEAVGGIVMMLKGENSNEVVQAVRRRVKAIQASLPPGVRIVPFLDRSDLVSRAIATVRNNLTEGALIVIFVSTLLLGNLRAGLVVASAIPLSLLFALAMMHLTGVSANLMSLGAIDFGLIVDGAVIVVESLVHRLSTARQWSAAGRMDQAQLDALVIDQACRIRRAAALGEVIILLVYLPLLTLEGIEGKMFKPMALTVSYAIVGALILSLTYVPALSALVLNRRPRSAHSWADRLVERLQALYRPVLRAALRRGGLVVMLAAGLLGLAAWGFSQLGGQFLPDLDEGDLALQLNLMPGSSLQQTLETTRAIETDLMRHFPEVRGVVSKIGSSEIPTDPMSIETADIMILLHPRAQWPVSRSPDELAQAMEAVLASRPGLSLGFSQPIQMRFNELMTGVKADVAIEVYGDDLDSLARLARQIEARASRVAGVHDLFAEQVSGLPQLTVVYRPLELARWGISRREANQTLRAAWAGERVGSIYENERRFDLVVRLPEGQRQSLAQLRDLPVRATNGQLVPLGLIADIDRVEGPAQISHYATRRRLTVSFNVRERDVESVVADLKAQLADLPLPVGYRLDFGGEFENLIQARQRLLVVLPVVLALIAILLFWSLQSWSLAGLIFLGIPFSTIGGVAALLLRDMPFSISAAVGFIALFGVSVLNGIVLIAHFEELRREGMGNPLRRVLVGSADRLRPVLMTALVAALGFLPMALSKGAGAEVQRPLATVVIGGLISVTALTLVLVPLFYLALHRRRYRRGMSAALAVGVLLLIDVPQAQAQPKSLPLDALLQAVDRHPSVRAAELDIAYEQKLVPATRALPPAELGLQYGQLQIKSVLDYTATVTQPFALPMVYAARRQTQEQQVRVARAQTRLTRAQVARQAVIDYAAWAYSRERVDLLQQEVVGWRDLLREVESRRRVGDLPAADALNLRLNLQRVEALLALERGTLAESLGRMRFWLQDSTFAGQPDPNWPPAVDLAGEEPPTDWQVALADSRLELGQLRLEQFRAERLPTLSLTYWHQSLEGQPNAQAVGLGLSLPWAVQALKAQREALEVQLEIEAQQRLAAQAQGQQRRQALAERLNALAAARQQTAAAAPTDSLIAQARQLYRAGEIDINELRQHVALAFEHRQLVLDLRRQYLMAWAELRYFFGF